MTSKFLSLLVPILLLTCSDAAVGAVDQEDAVSNTDLINLAIDVFDGTDTEIETFEDLDRTLSGHDSHRQLLGHCQGPTDDIHYFEVSIRLEPSHETGVCNIADQVLLGNDLNQLLLDFGIGDAGADDDVVFLAGVCTTPSTTRRRRKLVALGEDGFVYKGGGGCRYCLPEDYDRRGLRQSNDWSTADADTMRRRSQASSNQFGFVFAGPGECRYLCCHDNADRRVLRRLNDWFTDTFAPEMSAILEAAIVNEIVPAHTNCLGLTPSITVDLVQVFLRDLLRSLKCDDGRIVETLSTLRLGDTPLMRQNCHQCVSLDFSKLDDGTKINKGSWIKSQFHAEHGLTITAKGGYSPDFKARIFDTGDVQCVDVDGSRDFGSPNKNCDGGGLGVGVGGEEGASGENCIPIGNVLVVQESNKACPDSSSLGGSITFKWDQPVLLSSIGLMDVDEDDQRIKIQYTDGVYESFTYSSFGDNAVQRIIAGKTHVIKVEVIFPGTGAITEISFCPECRSLVSHDEDHHCLYTEDQTTIKAQEVVYYSNFESDNAAIHWSNGRRGTDLSFSGYLGDYYAATGSPYKTFRVDTGAAGVIIDLDLYKFYSFKAADQVIIYVGGEALRVFGDGVMIGGGTSPLGIVSTVVDTTGQEPEKLSFHVKIMVPQSTGLYADGRFRLLLQAEVNTFCEDEPIGWDNVKVTVIHACHTAQARTETFFQAPIAPPTSSSSPLLGVNPTITPTIKSTPAPTSSPPTLRPTSPPTKTKKNNKK